MVMKYSLFIITFSFLPFALVASRPLLDLNTIHVPILKHSPNSDRVANLPKIMEAIKHKYGFVTTNTKRFAGGTSSGDVPLIDEQNDISYSGVVSIGTPAQEFNLLLDTGSSDLWVVGTDCKTCPSGVPLFASPNSSTYQNLTTVLGIDYGSGVVTGYISMDTVTFGGFTLQDQELLSVDVTTLKGTMLQDGLSGLIGLAFQNLSSLETPPFWQALCDQNLLPQPMFGFYLERYVNQDQGTNTAPGGTLTLGGTNTSLYTGNIEFIDMPNGTTPSYWLQQVQSVTIQDTLISIPNNMSLAAIDTGTTLIGVPASISQQIWAQVPGSVALTGSYQGMYAFPCSTSVNISISFGGSHWFIDPADMIFGTINLEESGTSMCIGGTFDVEETYLGETSVPSWIIGDVFLNNVYSVFRADPPAVGFASLSRNDGSWTSGASSIFGRSLSNFTSSASLSLCIFLFVLFSDIL